MQISSNSAAYGDPGLYVLQRLMAAGQDDAAGQDLPGAAAGGPGGAIASSDPAPAPVSGQPQLAGATLASLLDVQSSRSGGVASTLLAAFDSDKSGGLSLAEVQSGLAKAGNDAAVDTVKAAFDKLDANGDGSLSSDELAAAAEARYKAHAHHGHHGPAAPPPGDDLAKDIVKAADTNGDGALSVDEIAAALDPTASGPAVPATASSPDGTAADAGDSAQTTVTAALKDAFAKVDADGNGSISADELKTALEAFRQAQEAAWKSMAAQIGAAASAAA